MEPEIDVDGLAVPLIPVEHVAADVERDRRYAMWPDDATHLPECKLGLHLVEMDDRVEGDHPGKRRVVVGSKPLAAAPDGAVTVTVYLPLMSG